MLLGSILGGLYTTISYVLGFENILGSILMSLLMIWVSFGYQSRKNFWKRLLVFYLVSITFGGASLLFARYQRLTKVLVFGIITGFILIFFVQKILKNKFEKICEIEICYKNKKIKEKALIDSGNLLKEKNSNLPVIIVEEKSLSCFPINLEETRAIPFSSLGNENGVLFGFKPDSIKIYQNDEIKEKEAFIGIYRGNLCGEHQEYHAIIGL